MLVMIFSRTGCLKCWVIQGRKLLYTGVKTRINCGGGEVQYIFIEIRGKICSCGNFQTVSFSPGGGKRVRWGKVLRSEKKNEKNAGRRLSFI